MRVTVILLWIFYQWGLSGIVADENTVQAQKQPDELKSLIKPYFKSLQNNGPTMVRDLFKGLILNEQKKEQTPPAIDLPPPSPSAADLIIFSGFIKNGQVGMAVLTIQGESVVVNVGETVLEGVEGRCNLTFIFCVR